ncbi:hypothetical protein HHL16_02250 [Pseudoflavitalea sp. G-6-1-2]|uniref:hypothetical protein n=1 Tax=Pseudoflavitalea sp. G-6-1-2 TaxID=2728841 RepID=UPI00146F347D|nr:hypothetical protein [Pseudoflavitalea sp. G-6-1-2]NML19672.1 hypothetical protein [Pseudoflavitalea sp. G-6-1-2]
MKRSAIQYVRTQPAVRAALAVGLMCLLVLLTTINFFIYSGDAKEQVQYSCVTSAEEEAQSNPNPAGPDEKSPGNPVSITEEYIHEGEDSVDPYWINALFRHKIHAAEQLKLVHFEILSPPPEA